MRLKILSNGAVDSALFKLLVTFLVSLSPGEGRAALPKARRREVANSNGSTSPGLRPPSPGLGRETGK